MKLKTREEQLSNLQENIIWDIVIIGGGATGLGCAVDSASRGFKTLLLEQYDFAKGTSSRSTKLVHGGVRYLAQGDVSLVREALKERGLLFQNAPHLVNKQSFVIPCFGLFSKIKYLVGLKLYDWLSGKYSFGSSIYLNKNKVLDRLKGISEKHVSGGIEYYDGQFDDARLAINLAQTAIDHGATVLNYAKVTSLSKGNNSKLNGLTFIDAENQKEYNIQTKSIINATGVFVDDILNMDTPGRNHLVRPSQGVHLVLDRSFMKGDSALMIPETSDGRVLFAVPWHEHLVVGTTDTPLDSHSLEPVALQKEINFILETAGAYLEKRPTESDVLSVFAGLRPLAAPDKSTNKTKEISRSHKLIVSPSGLVTITGGKWTTYRKMAEDTINETIKVCGLEEKSCATEQLKIHGYKAQKEGSYLDIYGSDALSIKNIIIQQPEFGNKLIDSFPYTAAEVIWFVRNEMARSIEDVLARRLRLLFLDAKAAVEIAPKVAQLMASEMGYGKEWETQQVNNFNAIASNYILKKK
ncbi:Glycerol-3-phosphate dehydrogenase [Pseudopedobacter saltans DSM 12145]|uniref:Glycerol-3-phosphate dehydrogenase n=1 Tax=Pseudopedobacter saltans (strain ATCC 51119 / DSM 12145 / JCM 21818 / CCUG 39354 / LMG 10337 / NBRC 100064 / NCIMB 13643) TaxID=762903 RepID=F0S8G6_PSESL|nr:glycerol-3-phosphate dehydrogenase/oxidase [Pseudopedobacter saltans]ADY53430.1 Glycerol-3-phosphate dehydrogenase [Pseudopedobacter saltans DSM 12145]